MRESYLEARKGEERERVKLDALVGGGATFLRSVAVRVSGCCQDAVKLLPFAALPLRRSGREGRGTAFVFLSLSLALSLAYLLPSSPLQQVCV